MDREKYHKEYYLKRKNNPDELRKITNARYLSRYGITLDEYEDMYAKQSGVCAICKSAELKKGRQRLDVDHGHIYGFIRALLCRNCNHGIGKFNNDPELLRAAANYLEEWQI
jgi:hypothetical protein